MTGKTRSIPGVSGGGFELIKQVNGVFLYLNCQSKILINRYRTERNFNTYVWKVRYYTYELRNH